MSQTPFMPLWVSDFLGDTMDLDAKEIGAYMLLLMAMWQRGGALPNDQKKLQRVARVGRDWPKVWAGLEHFFAVDGDQVTNARLTRELHKVDMKRASAARSGALGGAAKALKTRNRQVADATRSLYQPEPEPEKERKEGDFLDFRDPLAVAAKRIKAGEPFDGSYLSGHKRDELLARGLVSEEDLRRYGS